MSTSIKVMIGTAVGIVLLIVVIVLGVIFSEKPEYGLINSKTKHQGYYSISTYHSTTTHRHKIGDFTYTTETYNYSRFTDRWYKPVYEIKLKWWTKKRRKEKIWTYYITKDEFHSFSKKNEVKVKEHWKMWKPTQFITCREVQIDKGSESSSSAYFNNYIRPAWILDRQSETYGDIY